jgi:pyruvate dehydrogenase E2 component (dihydrolipoamide acetyltransferase)
MAETINMPKLGFDMAEGTLVRWVIQEGEAVAKGKVLAEIETDKATVEVESDYEGILARHLVKAGDVVPVSTAIAIVIQPGEKLEDQAQPAQVKPEITTPETSGVSQPAPDTLPAAEETEMGELSGAAKASPLARRMARDFRINLGLVKGSGPGGRIVKRDIETYLSAPIAVEKPAAQVPPTPTPVLQRAAVLPPLAASPLAPPPPDEIIPLSRLRAAIGRRMVEAKQQAPHFYVTHEYDVAALMALRQQVNALLPDDEKASVNDFVIKATALALRQFPNLNASLQDDRVIQHGQVNIGVAVALEGGLLTVVNRDSDRKPLRQIASEVRALVARAREGKVRTEDIEGSTFSISNMGMFDVEHFIAIINPPEAAILAVGSVREVAIFKDGMVAPGMRMKATISVDHRVSDGAEAARFMQALALYLENPLRLLL